VLSFSTLQAEVITRPANDEVTLSILFRSIALLFSPEPDIAPDAGTVLSVDLPSHPSINEEQL
jgi:hypothetical protein